MSAIGQCVSYPKSGRTWLRHMLEAAGCAGAVRFHHDGFEFNDGARPPHDFSLERRLERYPASAKVVYLERDPRDVMVSLYHQVRGRFRDFFAYDGDISSFMRDPYFGAHVLGRFRGLWSAILGQRPFLRISYEELHADSGAVLRQVLRYLDINVDEGGLASAVEAGRIENMRRLEMSGEHPHPWLRLREGHPKVRRGEIGAFRDELSAADLDYLDALFAGLATLRGGAND